MTLPIDLNGAGIKLPNGSPDTTLNLCRCFFSKRDAFPIIPITNDGLKLSPITIYDDAARDERHYDL